MMNTMIMYYTNGDGTRWSERLLFVIFVESERRKETRKGKPIIYIKDKQQHFVCIVD